MVEFVESLNQVMCVKGKDRERERLREANDQYNG